MIYSITIFLSAFLLFSIQPLIGKAILPIFGGSSAVWTSAMLFFQLALLIGYGYAHLVVTHLKPRSRLLTHSFLLLLSCSFLPWSYKILSAEQSGNPAIAVVTLLFSMVGLPYTTLSASSPLIQGILGRGPESKGVYRLYSVSNAGSVLALLLYPFLLEPQLGLKQQFMAWSCTYIIFSALLLLTLIVQYSSTTDTSRIVPEATHPPVLSNVIRWLLLSACGSAILVAETNLITQSIAAAPFLWLIPLTLYLLSFILVFANRSFYPRRLLLIGFIVTSTLKLLTTFKIQALPQGSMLIVEALYIFCACMLCHGELARIKPTSEQATSFYFTTSIGGVVGTFFVAILAPLIFTDYFEVELLLAAVCGLMLASFTDQPRISLIKLALVSLLLTASTAIFRPLDVLSAKRSFYGVVKVGEKNVDTPSFYFKRMFHGQVVHGLQFQAAEKHLMPTTYYGPKSGAGVALRNFAADKARNIAAIGLGVGTLAFYGNERDQITFFEINPDVITLAQQYFTFLKESRAAISLVPGDARLTIAEQSEKYDIIIVDAFSGDAIPTHLLTEEAINLYRSKLRTEGILVFHLTNMYLDLVPVVATVATHTDLIPYVVVDPGIIKEGQRESVYMILSETPLPEDLLSQNETVHLLKFDPQEKWHWRDDYSNLIATFKRFN